MSVRDLPKDVAGCKLFSTDQSKLFDPEELIRTLLTVVRNYQKPLIDWWRS